jgi:hypothetical protein
MSLILNGTDGLSDVDGSASTPAIRGTDTNTGIFFPAADTIAFAEGGAEVARFDSSGNLGIGTSSPSTKLHVFSTGSVGIQSQTSSAGAGFVQVKNNAGSSYLGQDSTGGYLLTDYAAPFLFYTNNAERMRINSTGTVLIGATSLPGAGPAGGLGGMYVSTPFNGIVARTAGAADSYECFAGVRNSTSGSVAAWWYNESTLVGRIAITSSATSYITSSDYRLKENVAPMTGALNKVALLKPVTYKWKLDGSDGQGFIAHELAEVCPDAVTGEKDAVNEDGSIKPQGIDTSFLVATLTAAIQEMKTIIDAQAERITALEQA